MWYRIVNLHLAAIVYAVSVAQSLNVWPIHRYLGSLGGRCRNKLLYFGWSTLWHFKTTTLTSPSLCICQVRVVRFHVSLISSSSLPPPLPPLPRCLLYCDHLCPVFPARKNVGRACCRMLPVSSIFANSCQNRGWNASGYSQLHILTLGNLLASFGQSFWHIFWHSFRHIFSHSVWHSLHISWHSDWRSFRHIFSHSFWHLFWRSF